MTYRVMKIGNKFAAQIIDDQGIPQSYISHDGTGNWMLAESVIKRCCVSTIEEAEKLGDSLIEDGFFERLLATATEVKS